MNKKEICYWANKARRYLNLPKIQIDIRKIIFPGYNEGEVSFNPEIPKINLIQPIKCLIVEKEAREFAEIAYSKGRLIWAIFHEMAHYFQWYHFRKWFDIYSTDDQYAYFQGRHCDKKLERNADKIANILYNKIYKINP